MRNLGTLVDKGKNFFLGDDNFTITLADIQIFARIGVLVEALMRATMQGLQRGTSGVSELLYAGLAPRYQQLMSAHPQRLPILTRLDLMQDTQGGWKIAEIDPSNKHGLGFSLALRYETGAGERQKLLSLLEPMIGSDLTIVLSRKESFFRFEQRYFAQKLAEHLGKQVRVIPEEKLAQLGDEGLILDLPICSEEASAERLFAIFHECPERFINPPRHALGGKALMALPFEYPQWLQEGGMTREEIDELRLYLPPTYSGRFVGKETFSSGAKGVFFDNVGKEMVFQKYIEQRPVLLDGATRFIRMACFLVGTKIGELAVTASEKLPVHGGNDAVNYHVNLRQ